MKHLFVLAAAALLGSCTVGPDYKEPPLDPGADYATPSGDSAISAASTENGTAQRFIKDMDIPGAWWTLFRSDQLDALLTEALKANPTLAAAQATLREAQENIAAEQGLYFPQVNANLGMTREKTSGAQFGQPGSTNIFTLTTGSLSVSYGLDFFGLERREIEALAATEDYQHWQLEAAYLTLTSNVVTAAIGEASLRAQIDATNEIIDFDAQQLDLLQKQFALGATSQAAVLAQQATLDAARATLPPLAKQLAQQRLLLTSLAGRFPSQQIEQTFDLAALHLPEDLPESLPSKLVEQRPDVQAASAQLHNASAEIGVATANMLPQITLSGTFGNAVLSAGQLFTGPGIWSIGGALAQPIFHGGQLLHEKRAAEAAFDASAAQYRNIVITAFQNVADALTALHADADTLASDAEAESSAAQNLSISQDQYRIGAINYTTLLNAETTYQQAHIGRVVAEASRFSDTAALFQALGGGWWNRNDVAGDAAGGAAK